MNKIHLRLALKCFLNVRTYRGPGAKDLFGKYVFTLF